MRESPDLPIAILFFILSFKKKGRSRQIPVDGNRVVLHAGRLPQPLHLRTILYYDRCLFYILSLWQLPLLLYRRFEEATKGLRASSLS